MGHSPYPLFRALAHCKNQLKLIIKVKYTTSLIGSPSFAKQSNNQAPRFTLAAANFAFVSDEYERDENQLKYLSFYLTIGPYKRVQDTLGFWILRHGFLIPGTGY